MGGRISAEEVGEWSAFEMIEGPVGPGHGDYMAAMICAVLAAVNGAKNAKLADYLVFDKPPKPKQTQKEIISILQGIGNAMKAD